MNTHGGVYIDLVNKVQKLLHYPCSRKRKKKERILNWIHPEDLMFVYGSNVENYCKRKSRVNNILAMTQLLQVSSLWFTKRECSRSNIAPSLMLQFIAFKSLFNPLDYGYLSHPYLPTTVDLSHPQLLSHLCHRSVVHLSIYLLQDLYPAT